jgi:catechol 2,3-dioxygenase-like lactoylglutathione lyase family enzyme
MMTRSALGSAKLVAFAATSNPDKARAFYRDLLGLRLMSEDPFALVFDANGTTLRVTPVEKVAVAGYTVLGWEVDDIGAKAGELIAAGIAFERYPFLTQDALGIWTAPSGAKVAWFKDPDSNILSIVEMP